MQYAFAQNLQSPGLLNENEGVRCVSTTSARRFNGKRAEMKRSEASLGPDEYKREGKDILKCVKKALLLSLYEMQSYRGES